MDEKKLNNMTLSSWAAGVWEKELRGVPLQLQESALAWCMRQHTDWRNFWNNLNNPETVNTPRGTNILVHIYNDASVKLQLDSKNPPEINQCFDTMRGKGFSDMDALHTIAFVLQEQTWNAKNNGVGFDQSQYVERVKQYMENVIAHPELMRGLRLT
jgi:Domain of unknown function (DUF1841)